MIKLGVVLLELPEEALTLAIIEYCKKSQTRVKTGEKRLEVFNNINQLSRNPNDLITSSKLRTTLQQHHHHSIKHTEVTVQFHLMIEVQVQDVIKVTT